MVGINSAAIASTLQAAANPFWKKGELFVSGGGVLLMKNAVKKRKNFPAVEIIFTIMAIGMTFLHLRGDAPDDGIGLIARFKHGILFRFPTRAVAEELPGAQTGETTKALNTVEESNRFEDPFQKKIRRDGQSKPTIKPSPSPISIKTPENNSDHKKAPLAKVFCEDLTNCPESVASLEITYSIRDQLINAAPPFECLGSLVGDGLLLTNRHCLPKDIQYVGASCFGRVLAHFPETLHVTAETLECAKVVGLSTIGGITGNHAEDLDVIQDFAILKMTEPAMPIKRRPFDLNRTTLSTYAPYTIIHQELTEDHRLKLIGSSCEIIERRNSLNEAGFHVSNCSVSFSDSGAPLLDGNKAMAGLLGGPADSTLVTPLTTIIPALEIVPTLFGRMAGNIPNTPPNTLKDTNDSCPSNNPNCEGPPAKNPGSSKASPGPKSNVDHLFQKFEEWLIKNDEIFRWNLQLLATGASGYFYSVVPTCIRPQSIDNLVKNSATAIQISLPEWMASAPSSASPSSSSSSSSSFSSSGGGGGGGNQSSVQTLPMISAQLKFAASELQGSGKTTALEIVDTGKNSTIFRGNLTKCSSGFN